MSDARTTAELIVRLSRVAASESWDAGLNPAQRMALGYLARANRFSRAPSHVAEYCATTRGTASQTLRALAAKGMIAEARSDTDRRTLRYDLTPRGREAAGAPDPLLRAVTALPEAERSLLDGLLEAVLAGALAQRGGRAFGICRTCRHFAPRGAGGRCTLIGADLAPAETGQLCHEHAAGAPA